MMILRCSEAYLGIDEAGVHIKADWHYLEHFHSKVSIERMV